MKSIRGYLLTRLLAGSVAILGIAGVVVYLFVARSLALHFDRNLSDRVQALASMLFQQQSHVEFEFSEQLMPEYGRREAPDYFELRFASGELLERSESLAGGSFALPEPAGEECAFWSATLPDGRAGRFVARRVEVHHVHPEEGPNRPLAAHVVIVVARGRGELTSAERTVMAQCALVGLLLLALLAALSAYTVTRGLEPARRLAASVGAIDVERLPERLDVADPPRELQPMLEKTNALIARVDDALKRERRTSADIAHELRTPISEILTLAEVALREREGESAHSSLRRVRDIAWRMGGAVATLLKLARLEMGAESFEASDVRLDVLVRPLLRSFAPVVRERELDVRNRIPASAVVRADADVVRIVLSNLLSNAFGYAPRGDTLAMAYEGSDERWSVSVENSATQLHPEDLDLLTQAFWRRDRARSDRGRSGLGLALSHSLALRSGLSLTFTLENGRLRGTLGDRDAAHRSARAASVVIEP